MIPLDLWNSEEMRKRRENAVAKALKEKPSVELRAEGPQVKSYRVKEKYTVEIYGDPDNQIFTSCECLADRPPIDEHTGLPSRESVPCFHVAAVLIHIAEEEKEDAKTQTHSS